MKNNYFILGLLTVFLCSCDKKNDDSNPVHSVDIKYGYLSDLKPGGAGSFYRDEAYFDNQDSVYLKNINGNLTVTVNENNLANEELNSDNFLKYLYTIQVTTSQDSEVFVKGNNVYCKGMEYHSDIINDLKYNDVKFEFIIPIKITNKSIKGNDTIEIMDIGDFINSNYVSQFSNKIAVKTLKVRKN